MLEFHLAETELFAAARTLDPHLEGLARFLPATAPGAVDPAHLLAVEAECRRDRLALLDATDRAYRERGPGRAYAAWLSAARPAELICTRKGDRSLDEVHRHIVRDSVQWLTLWLAGYRPDPLWHALAKAVALLAVLDDIVVPPQDVANGVHRLGGESLAEVLDRVKALGGDRDPRWLAEAHRETLFSARVQFHEKWSAAAPGLAPPEGLDAIQAYVREPDALRASILRTYAAETLPVLHLIAYYYRLPYDDHDRAAFLAAAVAQTLGMDISKDQYGIGVKEVTNFGVRPTRPAPETARRRTAIHHTFLRLTARFRDATDLPTLVYDRYSRVSLSYARLVDRYLERRRMTRLPMSAPLSALVDEVLTTRG
ncbi:hypothetical protein ABZW03_33345 [Kitasatospora sp. NPDC004799]|uniref:hypothetical protein n=1 Tax=Kitasatospora sp. NPDC004799 TaxID=3154460 RepID=UPI0033BC8FEE